ncbi:hypothetical protein DUI87_14268 [Hirundo rustica rustica]|uniref:Uncharacterized protein n=1 Tax=Hirundo rustica rustica TaxID=333673 RepID=A0A3M0KDY1_HIRRU|nr:hypothetical protein DUI87_14268 [Hirundo rustica rustica]
MALAPAQGCDESSGIAGTWIWSSWVNETELGRNYQGSKILVTSSGCWGFSEASEVRVPLLWAFQQAVHSTDMEMNLSGPTDSHNLNLETFPSCSRTILLELLWSVQQSKQSCPTFLAIPRTCDASETTGMGDVTKVPQILLSFGTVPCAPLPGCVLKHIAGRLVRRRLVREIRANYGNILKSQSARNITRHHALISKPERKR